MYNYKNNYSSSYNDLARPNYSSLSRQQNYRNQNFGGGEDHNFGELEFMLENERKRFKEAKQKFEYDLDNERKLRIEFENKLIKLKDQFSRKQVIISELEFKMNNLLHQNQDVIVENERLKNELSRFQDLYGGKIHELETQLSLETRNFDDMTNQYNTEFEKFKKEGQDYVEQISFDFERKIRGLEERVKNAEASKRDLVLENKKLNDILISNRLAFEQELRDLKNRARDEDLKKGQTMSKTYQQKLKLLEENKEGIIRKNNELVRLLQDKDRQIQELENQRGEEISSLRQENADLSQQINHLNYLISKLKSQISEKDNMLGRNYNDSDNEVVMLKQQLELKRQENGQLSSSIRDLRSALKDAENENERKRRDLVERCNFLQSEARKYKEEYQRICEVLKSRINDTINHVSYKK